MCWIVFILAVICSVEAAPVRLNEGTLSKTSLSGLVQVLYNNVWLSVCADGWNNNHAEVVCKTLGEYPVAVATSTPTSDYVTNYMAVVECSGLETNVSQCNISTTYWCRTRSLAGVICQTDRHTLRLADGHVAESSASGRVEVYYNGSWGSICDDDWDDMDARVVCNMLGYPSDGAVAMLRGHFGQGEGQIWLDEMDCDGNETSIFECRHDGWNKHNCNHDEDAGVECRHALADTLDVSLTHGHVGDSFISGRVKVRSAGVMGVVCDDYWDSLDASVVCRMLKLPVENAVALSEGMFGPGNDDFLLDDVHCVGNETSLAQCRHRSWGDHNCALTETAGVICQFGEQDTGGTENIRLVGGSSSSGTVEVLHGGQWGNVGDTAWDDSDAAVVCRMLGLPTENATALVGAHHGHGRYPTILDTLTCTGNESSLFDCPHSVPIFHDYFIDDVAGVNCDPDSSDDVKVRLMNGQYGKDVVSGRVEVLYQGQWGTVCNWGWDDNDAKVVCRMLGLSTAGARSKQLAYFGEGSSQIFLNHVKCLGHELSLSQCNHSGWGVDDCTHAQDAGVICQEDEESTVKIKLVGGRMDRSTGYGRLEVLYNGEWGTVCDGDWDSKESGVVCSMLGFSTSLDVETTENLTTTSLPVAFHGMYCSGNETNIVQCRHYTSWSSSANCSAGSKPADVSCYSESGCYSRPGRSLWFKESTASGTGKKESGVPVFAKLEAGVATNKSWSGRADVFKDGQWLAVCSDDWGKNETATLCRTFGFLYDDGAVAEDADSNVAMYHTECTGVQNNIDQCKGVVLNASQCTSGQHVTVTCLRQNTMIDTDESGSTAINETTTDGGFDYNSFKKPSYSDVYATENSLTTGKTSRASPDTESDVTPNDVMSDVTSNDVISDVTVEPKNVTPDKESKDKTDMDVKTPNKNFKPGTKEFQSASEDNDVVVGVLVPLAAVVVLAVVAFVIYRRVRRGQLSRLRNPPKKHECDIRYVPEKCDNGDDGYTNPVYDGRNLDDEADPTYSILDIDKEDNHIEVKTIELVTNDDKTH